MSRPLHVQAHAILYLLICCAFLSADSSIIAINQDHAPDYYLPVPAVRKETIAPIATRRDFLSLQAMDALQMKGTVFLSVDQTPIQSAPTRQVLGLMDTRGRNLQQILSIKNPTQEDKDLLAGWIKQFYAERGHIQINNLPVFIVEGKINDKGSTYALTTTPNELADPSSDKISFIKADPTVQDGINKLGGDDLLLLINPKIIFPSKKTDNFIQTLLHEEYHLMFYPELTNIQIRTLMKKIQTRMDELLPPHGIHIFLSDSVRIILHNALVARQEVEAQHWANTEFQRLFQLSHFSGIDNWYTKQRLKAYQEAYKTLLSFDIPPAVLSEFLPQIQELEKKTTYRTKP